MAFPFIFSASFDTGNNSEWDSEADTGSLLDFPHYPTLAAVTSGTAPYRGAYCMRITPGDTNDHTLIEGDIDIADTVTRWVGFALYISTDFAATADDIFNIFEWHSAGPVIEASISLQITAATDLVDIGIGEGVVASTFNSITKGVWHYIEALFTVDVTPGTGDVLTLYVDGAQYQTVTGGNVAAAISQGALGTQDTLSTTNAGYLLFDEFVFDDTRPGITHRWATHRVITASSFLFVGSGQLDNVKILDGGSGDVILELYDTDVYNASLEPRWRGRTTTANVDVDAADVPIEFTRGCLARFVAGTLPGGQFAIGRAVGWGSDGAVRTYASKRIPAPGNL